jgi:peptidoglycan/LPS O-acetylase OafA/YrhL
MAEWVAPARQSRAGVEDGPAPIGTVDAGERLEDDRSPAGERLTRTGDESGTAPGDRRFRPDVEGLRAVAIVLVVLYHGGLSFTSGGYVGVDVFFVISGFVITGVLLRERASTGRNSFKSFYGRRSRRIIPAATLVIITTVLATYAVLGALYGNPTAVDARWTAVFLANFHFSAVGSNYLTANAPGSPLLNFWSLAVEEQFYLVFPAFFVLITSVRVRVSARARLVVALSAVIAISLILSAVQTTSQPVTAYFSPFTRAWELALGALVAVSTQWLLRVPGAVALAMTWIGLAAIGVAAVAFNASTSYPGSVVAIPVVGAGLVIAGGTAGPRWGAEALLGIRPFRYVGRISYSLYLWHWPILVIVWDSADKVSQPFRQNVIWLMVALVAAAVTYRLFENPIRHARVLTRGWAPIAFGAVLISSSLVVATVALNVTSSDIVRVRPLPPSEIAYLVENASQIRSLPIHLHPTLAETTHDFASPPADCTAFFLTTSIPDSCAFGDSHAVRTMVLYGDSHAWMWFTALNQIAIRDHWRFVDFGEGACHVDALPYAQPFRASAEYRVCDQWHRFVLKRIRQLHPQLVVVTQEVGSAPGNKLYSPQTWQRGLERVLAHLRAPDRRVVVLGNTPVLLQSPPQCLEKNSTNVQACSVKSGYSWGAYNEAERAAAQQAGAKYVNVTPWFCTNVCSPVIGSFGVYVDRAHITATYSIVLEQVVRHALQI